VKRIIAAPACSAYLSHIALEHLTRANFLWNTYLGGNAMLSFDSYREVLSEHARGHHVVASAWFVVVAIIVFLVVFA